MTPKKKIKGIFIVTSNEPCYNFICIGIDIIFRKIKRLKDINHLYKVKHCYTYNYFFPRLRAHLVGAGSFYLEYLNHRLI